MHCIVNWSKERAEVSLILELPVVEIADLNIILKTDGKFEPKSFLKM